MEELTAPQKEIVRHQLDVLLRKALRGEACDYWRQLSWRAQYEATFSDLSYAQMSQLFVLDEYPSEQSQLTAQGMSFDFHNELLADALAALSDEKRAILLLAYCLDMSDREIAEQLNLVQRTVQYKRSRSLKEIKQ